VVASQAVTRAEFLLTNLKAHDRFMSHFAEKNVAERGFQ
jgi:hypothetical protein